MGCYFRLGAVKENNGKYTSHGMKESKENGKFFFYAYVYQFAENYEETSSQGWG